MGVKLNLILAACENNGIGINGKLPWRLKKEMNYFTLMTTSTKNSDKKNAVIMGRKTWNSIPSKYRPLTNRINVVLSKTVNDVGCDSVLVYKSLNEAVSELCKTQNGMIQWKIYGLLECLTSDLCHRIYITEIKKLFECDVFFEGVPNKFQLIKDCDVPEGLQEENGILFEYKVYEKKAEKTT